MRCDPSIQLKRDAQEAGTHPATSNLLYVRWTVTSLFSPNLQTGGEGCDFLQRVQWAPTPPIKRAA